MPYETERPQRPPEQILATKTIGIERKSFTLQRVQNARGVFLRVIEETGGRRNIVVVPGPGVDDFLDAVEEVMPEGTEP